MQVSELHRGALSNNVVALLCS